MSQRSYGMYAVAAKTIVGLHIVWSLCLFIPQLFQTRQASFENEIELKSLMHLFKGKTPCLFLPHGIKENLTYRNLNMVVCHFLAAYNPCGLQIHCDSVGPINQKQFSFIALPLRDWVN